MLTVVQQHAVHRFAKNLLALSDDALIDTYHQAVEDNRAARAEGNDDLSKAHAHTLAADARSVSLLSNPLQCAVLVNQPHSRRKPASAPALRNSLVATGRDPGGSIHAPLPL